MLVDATDNSLHDLTLHQIQWKDMTVYTYPNIFPLENIGLCSYFLGVIYLILAVMALPRLVKIWESTSLWTVTRTFYIFLFVFLLMRGLFFWIISALEVFHMGAHFLDEEGRHVWFQLLFVVPAYLFTSVYMLLFLAFIEIIIFSRVQFVITRSWFMKTWRYAFYIFNVFFYAAQVMSYAGVFVSMDTNWGKWIRNFILQSLWLCNFAVPFIALVSYSYITIRYAGFPFTNSWSKERIEKITRVFLVWSFGRVLSGLSFMAFVNKAWDTGSKGTYVQMYLVSIAIFTEGLPVLMVLNWTIVRLLQRQFNGYNETYSCEQSGMLSAELMSTVEEELCNRIWQPIEWQAIQRDESYTLHHRSHGVFSLYRGWWGKKDIVLKHFHTQMLNKSAVVNIADKCMENVVSHPSINQVYGLSKHVDGSFAIISQFWEKHSLFDIIKASPSDQAFAEFIVIRIGMQISKGMEYLHSKGLKHGYLTSRNVLLDSELNVKISDYNLYNLKNYYSYMITDTKFEGYWTEPGFLMGKLVTQKSDIYAFGYILWEMYSKDKPFEDLTFSQMSKKVLDGIRPPIPDFMTGTKRELTESCWKAKPNERPSFSDIQQRLVNDETIIIYP